MGWDVFVMNCKKESTLEEIEKAFAEGKPLVFDEFNKLSSDVLAGFANAVPKEKPAVGICYNPSGEGAETVPDDVVSMCVTQEMTVPNFKLIAEIMLFSEGFLEGEALGEKLVAFLEACK